MACLSSRDILKRVLLSLVVVAWSATEYEIWCARRGCQFICIGETLLTYGRNDKRPLLNVENPVSGFAIVEGAESAYLAAGAAISTEGRNLVDVVDHIIRIYRSHCE